MAKIDEIKEHINTLRNYLNILTAIILAVGAGVAKLYINDEIGLLFWIGIIFSLIFILIFALI
jgi:hypothetical protein